ncbi:MAG: nucleotide sugar dehydrogenase [Melioribacteraceae bacterium]|nr:nucleotide sugar dehydrogenase [Melioribacteraceae bacterium]MCF8266113.1 nucleotide sugar dehydrogenase [Melioribacteraceae bacterium]MCF8431503.1 nucleotide sugar dehydrogenase [Melioribacteraceae bacterium]
MTNKEKLLSRIEKKEAKIGIIGLGYVGLPLGLEFCEKGFDVLGFDLDMRKVNNINSGKSYIKHIPTERISKSVTGGKLSATDDFKRLPEVDAILICVPTPLDEHREPDMSYVVKTAVTISKYLREGQLVTLESTTYPGTTDELLLPLFEKTAIQHGNDVKVDPEKTAELKAGVDFFLAFSPEREDPNNPNFTTATIPKVVGGWTDDCLEVALKLYNKIIVKTVPVSSTRAAEATKLLENIYRSVNIALVNELKMVFSKMDIDVWEVIDAAATKPFGYHPFYPGPGLGGHCIPIDPFYLTWKARQYEVNTRFIELAGEINTHQPCYVVGNVMEALNDKGKALKGSKVLILGASYKKNIDDMRESPSLKLIELLVEKGAEVSYNDPYVTTLPATRKYQYQMESVELTKDNLNSFDVVLLSTDHDDYDHEFIHTNSQLVVDTRNAFGKKGLINGKIWKS